MKNDINGGKNITFVFCALIHIERFTFLDHKEIYSSYRSCGAKYLAECEIENSHTACLVGFPCLGYEKTISILLYPRLGLTACLKFHEIILL